MSCDREIPTFPQEEMGAPEYRLAEDGDGDGDNQRVSVVVVIYKDHGHPRVDSVHGDSDRASTAAKELFKSEDVERVHVAHREVQG